MNLVEGLVVVAILLNGFIAMIRGETIASAIFAVAAGIFQLGYFVRNKK